MSEQNLTIDDVRAAHEAMVHLVELGVVYAYRSGDPFDPIFISASRFSVEGRLLAIPPAELRRIFQRFQRRLIARNN